MSDAEEVEYDESEAGLLSISETQDLCNISYSRDATVRAFEDYFQFLTHMYLDSEYVVHPPAGGWPEITTTTMAPFHKTDEVVQLLRRLPYIRKHPGKTVHGMLGCAQLYEASNLRTSAVAALCQFADWADIARCITEPAEGEWDQKSQPSFWQTVTQGVWDHVPSHVVGLVTSKEYKMFLDTKLGLIYFPGTGHLTPGPVRYAGSDDTPFPPVRDEPIDYALEEEQWRDAGGMSTTCAWGIEDFFQRLKYHFRELHYVPVSSSKVYENIDNTPAHTTDAWDEAMMSVADVWRDHGWPDSQTFQKETCLAAIATRVQDIEEQHADVIFAAY